MKIKRPKTRGRYHKLDRERFVRIWNSSDSIPEVMRRYKWPKGRRACASAANNLRRNNGIKLKRLWRGHRGRKAG